MVRMAAMSNNIDDELRSQGAVVLPFNTKEIMEGHVKDDELWLMPPTIRFVFFPNGEMKLHPHDANKIARIVNVKTDGKDQNTDSNV